MPDVVDGHITERSTAYDGGDIRLPAVPSRLRTDFDEAAARRSLRDQIAKLERELAAVFASAYPRRGLEWRVGSIGGPRLLGIGELEEVRDALAARLED